MLSIGSFASGDCQGITRRAFVEAACATPFAWQLATSSRAAAAESAPKARSVLLVWLGGGPSHVDLFDPKPHAPLEYRGPFSTIATATPGLRFTELLPNLAVRSNRYSLVRSNVNFDGNHRPAGSIALDRRRRRRIGPPAKLRLGAGAPARLGRSAGVYLHRPRRNWRRRRACARLRRRGVGERLRSVHGRLHGRWRGRHGGAQAARRAHARPACRSADRAR